MRFSIPTELQNEMDRLYRNKDHAGLFEFGSKYENRNPAVFNEAMRLYRALLETREIPKKEFLEKVHNAAKTLASEARGKGISLDSVKRALKDGAEEGYTE